MSNLEFSIEDMERRMMMAGDVSVRLGGGDLIVTGDSNGNEVVIHGSSSAGAYVVEGINGTTINGQQFVAVEKVTDDVRINLRSGDNRLVLTTQGVRETGFSSSGSGGFETRNQFTVIDDLVIRTGSGDDIVLVGDDVIVGDDLFITTGGGDDVAVIFEASIDGRLRMNTGAGADALGFSYMTVRDRVSVSAGSGDDLLIGLGYQVDGDSRFSAGSGDDQYFFSDEVVSGDELLNGGAGDDSLIHMSNAFDDVVGDFVPRVETQTQLGFIDWLNAAGDAFRQHDHVAEAEALQDAYLG